MKLAPKTLWPLGVVMVAGRGDIHRAGTYPLLIIRLFHQHMASASKMCHEIRVRALGSVLDHNDRQGKTSRQFGHDG